jgi:hypothetical protein
VQEGMSRGGSNGQTDAQKPLLGRAVWELVSTTLAAGAAALTVNAAAAARQPVITHLSHNPGDPKETLYQSFLHSYVVHRGSWSDCASHRVRIEMCLSLGPRALCGFWCQVQYKQRTSTRPTVLGCVQ